jgi:hypothetical protein
VNNSIDNKMDNIDPLCWRSLIDFIGHQEGVLNETRDYHRYLGGLLLMLL